MSDSAKCVCGCSMSRHSFTSGIVIGSCVGHCIDCGRRTCIEFRLSVETKPTPESVYERARKAICDVVLAYGSDRKSLSKTVLAALDAGEAAERARDALKVRIAECEALLSRCSPKMDPPCGCQCHSADYGCNAPQSDHGECCEITRDALKRTV